MQYTSGIGISHLQHMRNALYGEVDEGFLAEFGEVGVERIECGDTGWTDNKGSETATEGYSMVESKSSLEGEGKGEFKVRNDWETY